MIRVGAEALGALLIALLMGDRKRRPVLSAVRSRRGSSHASAGTMTIVIVPLISAT